MSSIDEVEYNNLSKAVAAAEKLIHSGEIAPNSMLANFTVNASKRMEALEQEHGFVGVNEKKEKSNQQAAAIAALVANETKLNTQEQAVYASLLEKDYFTRRDVNTLEHFYSDGGAWDKLSDGGKDQISQRIDEGIRRGELNFNELPASIRSKEIQHREKDSEKHFSSKDLFEYQLVDTQAASTRSIEAKSATNENQTKEEKVNFFNDDILNSFADATEVVQPQLPKLNSTNTPSLPS